MEMPPSKIRIRLPQKDPIDPSRAPPPSSAMPPSVSPTMNAQPNNSTITVDRPPLPAPSAPPARIPDPVTIPALQNTFDDTTYDAVYARVPDKHKLDVGGLSWIKVDPYRVKPVSFTAWYSQPRNSYEVIQASKSLDVAGNQQRGRIMRCCSHCNNFVAEKTKSMKQLVLHLQDQHNVSEKNATYKADPPQPKRSRGYPTHQNPVGPFTPNAAEATRSRSYTSSQPDFVQQALQQAAIDERERAASNSSSISAPNVQSGLEHLLGELGRIKSINEGLMVRSRLNEELAHECERLRERNQRLEEIVQQSERLRERNQTLEERAQDNERLRERNQVLEAKALLNERLRERNQILEERNQVLEERSQESQRLRERNQILEQRAQEREQLLGRTEEPEGLAQESERLREKNQLLEQQLEEKTWEVVSFRNALSLLASSSSRQQREPSQHSPRASEYSSQPTSSNCTPVAGPQASSQAFQVVIQSKQMAPPKAKASSPTLNALQGKRKPMDISKTRRSKRSRSDSGVGGDD
ncbi:hypothetical protein BDZ45DRAFT_810785 [Acephala macrosclerotiorum]|nr:hypothetical protein BDZ45DRAFT_810785 [Acephala macrosclerotiorum]